MSTRLHIVVSDELVAQIDRARGDVPRAAWIRRAIEGHLGRDPHARLVEDGPGYSVAQLQGGMTAVTKRPDAGVPSSRCPSCGGKALAKGFQHQRSCPEYFR